MRRLYLFLLIFLKNSDVVNNEAVVQDKYNEVVKKVNAIQTTDTSDLDKKSAYNRKIVEIEKVIFDHNHYKYITTRKFNNLAKENFAAR